MSSSNTNLNSTPTYIVWCYTPILILAFGHLDCILEIALNVLCKCTNLRNLCSKMHCILEDAKPPQNTSIRQSFCRCLTINIELIARITSN